MGTNKLALALVFLSTLFASCGLDTDGVGDDQGNDFVADSGPDDFEPDVPGTEDAGPDEAELDETTPDETVGDVAEIEPDVPGTEDAEDSESEDISGDEVDGDVADDGETTEPCTRPDIPATGVHVFFCFVDDITADMSLSLQIERGGLPIFPWAEILDCTATGARSMFCELPLHYNAVYFFNIEIPGIGIGWSCGPGTDVLWGTPRGWVNHAEQTVRVVPNIDGGCNHQFTTPPSGPL